MTTKLHMPVKEEIAVRRATVPDTEPERYAVVQKAIRSGNAQDEAQALACLRAYPGELRINAVSTLEPIIDQIAGGNKLMRQIVANEAETRRKTLAGPNPSPLETLLIERIVACGLQVAQYERLIEINSSKGVGLDQAAWMHKKADMANRRYLSAIKALAQVRRLQVPMNVQVNVATAGGQQVNVGGAS
jgi:hypothetical protein